MRNDADRYEAYYAQKLWQLLPELYRAEDSRELDRNGPLRELVERIGAQAAVVRRSIDRLWEDQSVETCDDWAIAYMADLLATNLVPGLDARGQRRDVAKTIYYRRRKGTVPQLEELAADLTDWDVRVVEFFRRLGRHRHRLDPALGGATEQEATLRVARGLSGPLTRTAIGGTADLRSHHGARLAHTAFDEFFHTADVRRGQGSTGWHGIPRLGVFLWRLRSVPLESVTPVRDATCPNQYTFDPTGRDIPLFAASSRVYGDMSPAAAEHQFPVPISGPLLQAAFAELYAATSAMDSQAVLDHSLGLYRLAPTGLDYQLVEYTPPDPALTADPRQAEPDYLLLPERGRFLRRKGEEGESFRVGYHAAFSSDIGAGGYDRRLPGGMNPEPVAPVRVSGGGDVLALALENGRGTGTVLIEDSLTYTRGFQVEVGPGALTLRADNHRRPVLRRPPGAGASAWTFTGLTSPDGEGSDLILDGLFFCGDDVVLQGTFRRVVITTCTLDPGNQPDGAPSPSRAADGKELLPCRLLIQGQVRELEVERSIVGPIRTEGSGTLERMSVVDTLLQASRDESLLRLTTTDVRLKRCTVLGTAFVHRLDADTCILHDVVRVTDNQHGCVRFSAWSTGSTLPRRYESVQLAPRQTLFASRSFGRPDYGQLLLTAPTPVTEGAEDGSEMGAFCREKNALKARALRIKFEEYMPIGLSPVWVYVT